MLSAAGLKIKVVPTRGILSPVRRVPVQSMDSSHGVMMLNAIDAEIAGSKFFEKQWMENQSTWQPLSPLYVEEKVSEGLSPRIWKLSGDSLRALSTPVMVNSSNMYGRTSRLVYNAGYAAECVWLLGYPAASGWPGDKGNQSYFAFNQITRPWRFNLDSGTRSRCENRAAMVVRSFWNRMMAIYFLGR